jgi:molybdopterin/thiamine biosynthesis adenylyltransferase
MAVIHIPVVLRSYVGGQAEVTVRGKTVGAAFEDLLIQFPAMRPHLTNGEGKPLPVVDMLPELTREEILRYSRHLLIPDVGLSGQRKLKASSALIIGTGGLGSPVALYLAAAGVGRIGLVDYDVVDETNLQRQVVHGTSSVGKLKVESAKARLLDLNPAIQVDAYNEPFTSANAMRIAAPYDVIIDGTDNFPTRYLTNDLCVLTGKPNVYGSIFRFDGQASVFDARTGPCYRCLFPEPPPPGLVPSCAEGGVLGVLPGTIGTIQATEALKILLGIGSTLVGKLLLYNALDMTFEFVKLKKNPKCKVCGPNPEITELIDYFEFCGVPGLDHDRRARTTRTGDLPHLWRGPVPAWYACGTFAGIGLGAGAGCFLQNGNPLHASA